MREVDLLWIVGRLRLRADCLLAVRFVRIDFVAKVCVADEDVTGPGVGDPAAMAAKAPVEAEAVTISIRTSASPSETICTPSKVSATVERASLRLKSSPSLAMSAWICLPPV